MESLGLGKKRKSPEGGLGPQIFKQYKKAMIQSLTEIHDRLDVLESDLSTSRSDTFLIADLVTEKEYRLGVKKYGEHVGELRDECLANGITAEEFDRGFGVDKDQVRRLKDGRGFPPKGEDVRQMFANLEGRTKLSEKTSFDPERQAALEWDAHEAYEARKARETLKERIDRVEAKLQRKAEFEANLAACVGALRRKVASLKQQQAVSGGQGQSLRRRIELAEAALKRALERREVIKEELVACAIRALKALGEVRGFLDF
ncbi:hypothetical protein [Streptomyces sp. NPDC050988]|uniref:hypothetical protein n=1 Tax=Streptomyces sp. NPDC050988 TaxID=3365637 RepID=UPI00379AEC75